MQFLEPWIILAFLAALASSGVPLVNEYFKVNALYLLLWLRMIVVCALAPITLQFPVPEDWRFYASVLAAISCFVYFDFVYFTQAARSGAGMISRMHGLIVGMSFVMWLIVDPALVMDYIRQPVRGGGIALSVAAGVYFALRMRRCHLTLAVLKEMFPALFLASLGVVFGKLAMQHSEHHQGVWYYAFLQSVFAIFIYTVALKIPFLSRHFNVPENQKFFDRRVMAAAGCLSVFWLMDVILRWYAITDVENPAYVTIIGLTSPLWVLLVYRAWGKKEEADIKSGLGLVFSAAMLVFFASLKTP